MTNRTGRSVSRAVSLRYEHWPIADQQAWTRALEPGGLFDQQGPAAHWAAATRNTVRSNYGVWLQWCDDHDLLSIEPACERVTRETLASYLAELQRRLAPHTQHSYLSALYRVMVLFSPVQDWDWFKVLVNRLERLKVSTTDKAGRLQDSTALMALGERLMADATARPDSDSRQAQLEIAIEYRDGLMLALLAARPLRRTNFVNIQLRQHLVRSDRRWWLHFTPDETKQRQPIEQALPAWIEEPLNIYLAEYRPRFLGSSDHNYLWASRQGGRFTGQGFYRSITQRTRRAFGQSVNPHLFRDCAATTIARHTPEAIGTASQLLGHSRMSTTERHYNQAGSVSASRQYQAALAAMRDTAARRTRS